jgi:hypothetical protein
MTGDPIVEEVRKARDEIFRRCGYDLEKLGKYLKRTRKGKGTGGAKAPRLRGGGK